MNVIEIAQQIKEKKEAIQKQIDVVKERVSKYTEVIKDLNEELRNAKEAYRAVMSGDFNTRIIFRRTERFQNKPEKFIQMKIEAMQKKLDKAIEEQKKLVEEKLNKAISGMMEKQQEAQSFVAEQAKRLEEKKKSLLN